jgi:hypothetical protein
MPVRAVAGTSGAAPWPISWERNAASCSSRPVKDRTGGGIIQVRSSVTAGRPPTSL